jgi:L-asparagine transporter-like permease
MLDTLDTAQFEGDLKRRLHVRHLIMLSVGGTIASGFFLFSGSAIAIAGPSVVIAYAIAGVISLAVMACLAEMAVTRHVAGSFAIFAQETMGHLPGFLTGWNYWLAWVMGAATESVAAGTYFHVFVPSVPIWVVAGVITLIEMIVNLVGVLFMGEYEFILSSIKLIGLAAFIVIGGVAIFTSSLHTIGLSGYTGSGGFFPNGVGAVGAALLPVFFAYVGIELVGVTAEESVHPERDVPRSLIWTAVIVAVLFIVASLVLLGVISWTKAGTSSSPFVDGFNAMNLTAIGAVFNWIVILASLSSVDGGLYTASRMMFAISREGYLPKVLSRTHPKRKTPNPAIFVTSLCIFFGAVLAYFFPNSAYIFVASLSSFGFLYAWLMISISQPLYRIQKGPEYVRNLKWKTPLYPLTPLVAIVAVLAALIGQFFAPGSTVVGPISIPGSGGVVVIGILWTLVWAVYYLLIARGFGHGHEWRASQGRGQPPAPDAAPSAGAS